MKILRALRRGLKLFLRAYTDLWQLRVLAWLGAALFVIASISAIAFHQQHVDFAFARQQCVADTVVLPSFQKNTSDAARVVSYQQPIAIAGKTIVARGVCYEFTDIPHENSRLVLARKFFGMSFMAKNTVFQVSGYPKLQASTVPTTISTSKPLTFELTKPDNYFAYTLQTGQATSSCVAASSALTCQVAPLALEHSKKYELSIVQSFNGIPVHTVASIETTTANPITITSNSITNSAIVYDKPAQMTLVTDRPIQAIEKVSLTAKVGNAEPKNIALTSKINGTTITLTWAEPLPRLADISLTIGAVSTADGGTLLAPYSQVFKTSGGPKVNGINIRDRAVSLNQKITLNLDQALQPGQNLGALFGIKVAGTSAPATVTTSGKTVTIVPNASFSLCAKLQVWVADGVVNTYGISGGSAWTFNSRSTCATSFSIGTSVRGRSIIAYKFGSGTKTALFNGNLHGNEQNSKRLLDLWMDELEGNPERIPAGKSIVIIPQSNPDGSAANSRTNVNNVDLNRNFPANNWKSTVKMPSGETLATGGGVTPLSEPESNALAAYVSSLMPSLVMSYHSRGNVVVANDVGNSWALTLAYNRKSGYGAQNGSTIGNFFDYDTTGAFEDWLADKKGIPAILVELSTRESDEFYRNKNAMWQIVADY